MFTPKWEPKKRANEEKEKCSTYHMQDTFQSSVAQQVCLREEWAGIKAVYSEEKHEALHLFVEQLLTTREDKAKAKPGVNQGCYNLKVQCKGVQSSNQFNGTGKKLAEKN